MNDVQQILLWEERRKALEWWYNLPHNAKIELKQAHFPLRQINSLTAREITILYNNR